MTTRPTSQMILFKMVSFGRAGLRIPQERGEPSHSTGIQFGCAASCATSRAQDRRSPATEPAFRMLVRLFGSAR